MRNKPETLHEYNIPRLHWWFLIASILFVGCFVLMIWVDYSGGTLARLGLRGDRQWKQYQRAFYDLERQRLADDAQAAEARAQEQGLGKLRADLTTATRQLTTKKAERDQLRAEVDRLQTEANRETRTFTMEKAKRDEFRSFYEAAAERNHDDLQAAEVKEWRAKVKVQNGLVAERELRKQEADAALAAAQAKLEKLVGQHDDLQRQINRLTASVNLIDKRLGQLQSPLVQTVVNAPVIEFAVPTYKVEQIVTESHHVDVNFTTVARVDRCITCHKAIDRKPLAKEEIEWRAKHKVAQVDWSKQPQPLSSHPRLDLFVADTSAHPASKYGCTVCHWGWDRETDFSRAGHTPDYEHAQPYEFDQALQRWVPHPSDDDEEGEDETPTGAKPKKPVVMTEREAWQKNYHWQEQEFLVQQMREPQYVQASCLKCHQDQTSLTGAEKLDQGRRLIEQLGCWSCHKMRQLETYTTHLVREGESLDDVCKLYDVNPDDVRRLNNLSSEASLTVGRELTIPVRTLRKPGPSLFRVATKTNKDWTRKWLSNPVAFRPNTYMPRFWGLENNTDPVRDNVEINAVAGFLFAVSEPNPYPAPPVAGQAGHGQELVGQLGCLACHVIDEDLMTLKPPATLARFMDAWDYRRFRSQGPQLAGSGSKVNANWIYAWLKDPKQYHPGTKMPNLRLSDQEAADVAAYLTTLHNEKADQQKLAGIDPDTLNAVTLEYLQVTLPLEQAQKKLGDLDDLIESYYVDEATMKYYREPALMAREESRLRALRKEYEETFDDAVQKRADQLAASLKDVKAKMAAARQKVATLSPADKKNVFLGSKLITRYGCYACHNIHGFESAKPIGTELSEWGSKPVNKLDFGLLPLEPDRIAWLKQKLHAPRSFDKGRIGVTRSPQEYLKMGKFNLTKEQVDQIVTVISGLTDEKLLASEPRQLSPDEFHIERGRWLVKELNCKGCHQVEGHGWGIRATGIPGGMEPPMLSGQPGQLRQGQRTQPDWLFHFLKAPQTGEVRPWLKVRMPTFGLTDAEANVLVRYFALEGRSEFPYQSAHIDRAPEHLAVGKQLFDQLKCALCHIVEGRALGKLLAEIPDEDLPRLAPNLSLAGRRLQRDWLIQRWLPEPLAQVPGTRMPQFEYGEPIAPKILGGDGRKQREALVDYILTLGEQKPPAAPAPPATAAE